MIGIANSHAVRVYPRRTCAGRMTLRHHLMLDVPSLVRDVPISGPSIEYTEEDESPDEFFRTYDSSENESDCDDDEGDL